MSDIPPNSDGLPTEQPKNTDYWIRTEKAIETLRIGIETGEVDPATADQFCHDIENNPLVPLSFYDEASGRELEAMPLVTTWYANRRRDAEESENQGDLQVNRKRQETARKLAEKIIQGFADTQIGINNQYGPFAKFVNPNDVMSEFKERFSVTDREILSDPLSVEFLQKQVYGIAVPNIAYSRILRSEIAKGNSFSLG